MATFKATDLVFVVDVTSDDHDIANFEFHDGENLVRRNAVTCGMTNPPGKLPGYEDKEFAVDINEPDNFYALRDALRAMVDQLDAVEEVMLARNAERAAEKAAAEARNIKRAGRKGK